MKKPLSPKKQNAIDCYNELQSRARTIEEQQARLDAIAAIASSSHERSSAGSRLVRVWTESEAQAVEVLARGTPKRAVALALKRWGKKENGSK